MTLSLELPNSMEAQLRQRAEAEQRTMEDLALEILAGGLAPEEPWPTLEEVVAKIKASPPNPKSIRRASGSLADALRDGPDDPDFDVAEWNRQWAAVEAEMNEITRNDDIAEGRG